MAACTFRGCPFPAIWLVRDINSDVWVCQQHGQFLDVERGVFVDQSIGDAMARDIEKHRVAPTISTDTGRTVDDDLSIHRTSPPRFSRRPYKPTERNKPRPYKPLWTRRRELWSRALRESGIGIGRRGKLRVEQKALRSNLSQVRALFNRLVSDELRRRTDEHKTRQRKAWQRRRSNGVAIPVRTTVPIDRRLTISLRLN